MKLLLVGMALVLIGCTNASSGSKKTLTYQELLAYPVSCDKADKQLEELKALQREKNFDPDSDNLNTADQEYNSRLKATIWWFAYSCDQS
jgi:hypothetical protein